MFWIRGRLVLMLSFRLAVMASYMSLNPKPPPWLMWVISPGSLLTIHTPPPPDDVSDVITTVATPAKEIIGANFAYYSVLLFWLAGLLFSEGRD